MMLADHMYGPIVVGQAIADWLPRLTVVGGHINVDVKIVAAMAVEGRVSSTFSVARSNYSANVCPFGNTLHLFRNVLPVLSSITGDLQVSIVGTYPQQVLVGRRLVDGCDRRPHLYAVMPRQRVFVRDLAHDWQLVTVLGRGEVGAEPDPAITPVGGFEEIIATIKDGLGGVRRNYNGRVPLEAVTLPLRGRRPNGARFVGIEVAPQDIPVLGFSINNVGIGGIDPRVEPIAAAHRVPVGIGDAARIQRGAWSAPGVVVRQASADVVGLGHVEAKLVELPQGDGVHETPASPSVAAHVDATIAAEDDVVGIVWINPDGMEVAMNARDQILAKGATAIIGVVHLHAAHPDPLVVVRVDADLAEIHAAGIGIGHLDPCL